MSIARRMTVRDLALCAMFAALTAVLSQLAIPLPFSPVPLTLSVAAVFLCGAILPPGKAALAQAAYLLLGAVGLPVFAQMRGGLPALIGPTGGYLISYPLMAAAVSLGFKIARKQAGLAAWISRGAGALAALALCYALGVAFLMAFTRMTPAQAIAAGVAPFALVDLLKAAACVFLGELLSRRLR